MPDGLKVSLETLTQSAIDIRKAVGEIQSILDNITLEMNKVPDVYKGQASQALMEKYYSLTGKYEAFKTQMEFYGMFLDKTVKKYSEADEAIARQAQQMQD